MNNGNILISEGALEKAESVGPIIKDLTGEDLEWSGFMLARKGDPKHIVRDIWIQDDQDIKFHDVKLSGEAITTASHKISELYPNHYVSGWIHGHGLARLVPSSTDKDNFRTVLNSVSLNTETRTLGDFDVIESDVTRELNGNVVRYNGTEIEDGVIQYSVDPEKLQRVLRTLGIKPTKGQDTSDLVSALLDSTEIKLFEPVITGFAQFAIVNNQHHEPYASRAYFRENIFSGGNRKNYSLQEEGIRLEEVVVDNDIFVTPGTLQSEIESRIDIDGIVEFLTRPIVTGFTGGFLDGNGVWIGGGDGSGIGGGGYVPLTTGTGKYVGHKDFSQSKGKGWGKTKSKRKGKVSRKPSPAKSNFAYNTSSSLYGPTINIFRYMKERVAEVDPTGEMDLSGAVLDFLDHVVNDLGIPVEERSVLFDGYLDKIVQLYKFGSSDSEGGTDASER